MRITVAAAVACLGLVGLATANDVRAAIRKPTNIPAQLLGPALASLAEDRDFQVLYRTEVVGQKRTQGAAGDLTLEEAMRELLEGTGLSWRFIDARTVKVFARTEEAGAGPRRPASGADTADAGASSADGVRLAQATAAAERESASSPDAAGSEQAHVGVELEEIVVTATKRSEKIQNVPMSVAVIGNQEIERRGLIGMEDYLRSVPGVNQIDQGGKDNAIVIRGITTSPVSENFNSGATVGTYFGETPITGAAGIAAAGIDVRPVDMERVEILRGPQGTTYGSASLGGTVRIIPVSPRLDRFGIKAAASYSETSGAGAGNSMAQGVINVPLITDELGFRVVGYRYGESGFYRNIAAVDPASLALADAWGIGAETRASHQDDVGEMISTGGRFAALWQPSTSLDVSLNFLTQDIEQTGLPESSVGTYEQRRFPIGARARVRDELGEYADTELDLASLVVNYNLGWATLTTAGSWVDGSSGNALDGFSGGLNRATSLSNTGEFESYTIEARLASQLDGPWQFLAGLFYEDVSTSLEQINDRMGPTAPLPPLQVSFVTDPLSRFTTEREHDQRAVFGELSYAFTDRLSATVGARYFEYDKKDVSLREGSLNRVQLGAGVPATVRNNESDTTYKTSISFRATPDALLYATWSQGFRLGRPTAGVNPVCDANGDGVIDGTGLTVDSTRTIQSDFLDNYEIGAKLSLFDRRVTVEASAFHIEWEGLPIAIRAPVAPTGCGLGFTTNVGAATSDGVDFQATLLVTQGLRLAFGAGYNEAELSEDAPLLNPPALEGARLPGSPRVNANFAAQYDFRIGEYGAFVRADSFYTGELFGNLQESPLTAAGDYIKVDGRAGIVIRNLTVELFVRNLTNEDAYTWRGLANANSSFGYRLRPRTVGVQLGYSY